MKFKRPVINHIRNKRSLFLRTRLMNTLSVSERTLFRKIEEDADELKSIPVLGMIAEDMNCDIHDLFDTVKSDLHKFVKKELSDIQYKKIHKIVGVTDLMYCYWLLNNPKQLSFNMINNIVSHINRNKSDDFMHPYKLVSDFKAGIQVLSPKELDILCNEYELLNQ